MTITANFSMASLTDSQQAVLHFVREIYPEKDAQDLAEWCQKSDWDSNEISRLISENPDGAVAASWQLIENRKTRRKKDDFKQAHSNTRKKKQFGKRSRKRNERRRKNKGKDRKKKRNTETREEKQPAMPLVIQRSTTVNNHGSWAQKAKYVSKPDQGRPSQSPLTNITDQSKENELVPPRKTDVLQTPPGILNANSVWHNVRKVDENESDLENIESYQDFYRDQSNQYQDKMDSKDHVDVFIDKKQAFTENVEPIYDQKIQFEAKPQTQPPTNFEHDQYSRSTDNKQAFNDQSNHHYSDYNVGNEHVYHQFGDPVLHEQCNVQAYSGTGSRSRPESVSGVTMPNFGGNNGPFSSNAGVTMPASVPFSQPQSALHSGPDQRLHLSQKVELPPQLGQMNTDTVFQFGCDYVEDDRKIQSNEQSQEDNFVVTNEFLIQQNDIIGGRTDMHPQRQREVEIHSSKRGDPPTLYGQSAHRNFTRNPGYRNELDIPEMGGLNRRMDKTDQSEYNQLGSNIVSQARDPTSSSQIRLANQFDERRENIVDNRRTFGTHLHSSRTVNMLSEDSYDKGLVDIPPDSTLFSDSKHFHGSTDQPHLYQHSTAIQEDYSRQIGLETERTETSRQNESFYPHAQQNPFRANQLSQQQINPPRSQGFQKKQNFEGFVNQVNVQQSMPQTFEEKPDYSPTPPDGHNYGAQMMTAYQISPYQISYYAPATRTTVVYPPNQIFPYGPR